MPDSSEIEGLKSIALAGGGREAVRLAAWYMKFPSGPDTFEYWSVIAAENGNDVGQYNVGMLYLKKPLPGYWGQEPNIGLNDPRGKEIKVRRPNLSGWRPYRASDKLPCC